MYCRELKPPEKNQNNTEFLIEFNKYIDNETPNHPSCECSDECVFVLTNASLPVGAFTSFFIP